MSATPSILLRVAAAAIVAATCIAAAAQTPPPDGPATAEPASRNQRIENIHVEDGGAKVDEVRYGGRTQSISVQPKANVPSYQVLPDDGNRQRPGLGSQEPGSNGNGQRVWNVMKF